MSPGKISDQKFGVYERAMYGLVYLKYSVFNKNVDAISLKTNIRFRKDF